jgi:hypothetical protein
VRVVIGPAGVALLELPEDMVALDKVEYEYHLTFSRHRLWSRAARPLPPGGDLRGEHLAPRRYARRATGVLAARGTQEPEPARRGHAGDRAHCARGRLHRVHRPGAPGLRPRTPRPATRSRASTRTCSAARATSSPAGAGLIGKNPEGAARLADELCRRHKAVAYVASVEHHHKYTQVDPASGCSSRALTPSTLRSASPAPSGRCSRPCRSASPHSPPDRARHPLGRRG